MKNILTLLIILQIGIITSSGQCVVNYSQTGANDTINFTNLSTVSNAHYYWYFGDGSGSNMINPTHIFPDNGKYLVILYGQDTVSNCVDKYESWISINKPDTISCNIILSDTIQNISGTDVLITSNQTTNCSWFKFDCDAGPAINQAWNVWLWTSVHALYLDRIQAYTYDSINAYRVYKEYYKTVPYRYSSNINYQNCSANFEIATDYQQTGAVVTLTAMNKAATSYTWQLMGYGNPFVSTYTTNIFCNYVSYEKYFPTVAMLTINDSINGCQDTVSIQVLIKNPYYSFPTSCEITYQPQNQTAIAGSSVQFSVLTTNNADYQWQQNAGFGFVNLSNAGPYSGVHTNILTINNLQTIMNNYQYRCIVFDSTGDCHNTSSSANLSVMVGINEIKLMDIKIFPNPAFEELSISFPDNVSNTEINIYNLIGEKIISSIKTGKIINVQISDLSKGIYFIEVKLGNENYRQKFTKL